MRLKHIGWYEGEYSPSDEEYYLFVIDKDFVGSPEYLTYRKEEIDSVAKKRADIYAPSDEEVKRNIAPFVELVRSDINSLVEIGSKMEISNISQENVSEIADYFCAKFDVEERPKTELIWGSNLSGAYNHNNHKIKVEFSKTCSVAELVSTIAHEVWHAHQYRSDSELYKYNWGKLLSIKYGLRCI